MIDPIASERAERAAKHTARVEQIASLRRELEFARGTDARFRSAAIQELEELEVRIAEIRAILKSKRGDHETQVEAAIATAEAEHARLTKHENQPSTIKAEVKGLEAEGSFISVTT